MVLVLYFQYSQPPSQPGEEVIISEGGLVIVAKRTEPAVPQWQVSVLLSKYMGLQGTDTVPPPTTYLWRSEIFPLHNILLTESWVTFILISSFEEDRQLVTSSLLCSVSLRETLLHPLSPPTYTSGTSKTVKQNATVPEKKTCWRLSHTFLNNKKHKTHIHTNTTGRGEQRNMVDLQHQSLVLQFS